MSFTTDRNDPALHQKRDDGQNEKYLVLSEDEIQKGFVRPVRQSYIHKKCGRRTKMGRVIAETYARDPRFYTATFCCHCGGHFALRLEDGAAAFEWGCDGTPVGE